MNRPFEKLLSNRLLSVRFVSFDHRAKCKVDDCSSHENLYRLGFNSVDYVYLCKVHVARSLNEAVLGVWEIDPFLLEIKPDNEHLKSIVAKSMEKLQRFKTFGAHDLVEEISKRIEGEH